MSKQIKVIKCPQCGNTKPLSIGQDRYRCDKCGTEFFLDNNDVNVNVNVNHQHDKKEISGASILKIASIFAFVAVFMLIVFFIRFCVDQVSRVGRRVNTTQVVADPSPVEYSRFLFSTPLSANGQGILFYLKSRQDKTVAYFQDIVTGNPIREQELPAGTGSQKVTYRWFRSDSTHYVILDDSRIYMITPEKYAFTSVTDSICARKPALNAGLMSVSFVPEEQGEGFLIHSNLGKDLYYFPEPDMLYTKKAFQFLKDNPSQPLLPGSREEVYYLFYNQESAHSSNVARLFEVRYKFNNGGPENRLMGLKNPEIENPGKYRIVSCKPITDERIYFSPEVLLYDDRNILISYWPSLSDKAVMYLQLLDISGNIVWTQPLGENVRTIIRAIRTDRGFIIQTAEDSFYEVSSDGKNMHPYEIS